MSRGPAGQPASAGAATPAAGKRHGVARFAPVGAARRLAMDLTLRLPPPVGGRAARLLRRLRLAPGIGPRRDAALALELERASRAFHAGDLRAARAGVDLVYRALPAETRVRALRTEVLEAQGELTELARLQLAVTAADPTHRGAGLALRATLGRLAADDPGWAPRVPGPRRPLAAADPDTVLVLAPPVASGPAGAAMTPAAATVAALAGAGARPVAVGVDVHGIAPDLAYPAETPLDVRLEHEAWLVAGVARRERPAVLHVVAEPDVHDASLVGLAVRDHLRRPLVYEPSRASTQPARPAEPHRAEGELARRQAALEARILLAADHVLVRDEATRDEIIAAGVVPARISVVPRDPRADAATTGRLLRDAYRTVLEAWDSRGADA